jgi:hypothetical protein
MRKHCSFVRYYVYSIVAVLICSAVGVRTSGVCLSQRRWLSTDEFRLASLGNEETGSLCYRDQYRSMPLKCSRENLGNIKFVYTGSSDMIIPFPSCCEVTDVSPKYNEYGVQEPNGFTRLIGGIHKLVHITGSKFWRPPGFRSPVEPYKGTWASLDSCGGPVDTYRRLEH